MEGSRVESGTGTAVSVRLASGGRGAKNRGRNGERLAMGGAEVSPLVGGGGGSARGEGMVCGVVCNSRGVFVFVDGGVRRGAGGVLVVVRICFSDSYALRIYILCFLLPASSFGPFSLSLLLRFLGIRFFTIFHFPSSGRYLV